MAFPAFFVEGRRNLWRLLFCGVFHSGAGMSASVIVLASESDGYYNGGGRTDAENVSDAVAVQTSKQKIVNSNRRRNGNPSPVTVYMYRVGNLFMQN